MTSADVVVVAVPQASVVAGMVSPKMNTRMNLSCTNTKSKHRVFGMTVAPVADLNSRPREFR